jgi:hypothetical protein
MNEAEIDTIPSRQCPKCRCPIEENTRVCPHCQSKLTIWGKGLRAIEVLSFMATAITVIFLYHSIKQTQYGLDLSKLDIARNDSLLTLNTEQIQLMKEANNIERNRDLFVNKKANMEEMQYINDQKPILAISSKGNIADGILTLGLDITNNGKSTASEVQISSYYFDKHGIILLFSQNTNVGIIPPNKITPFFTKRPVSNFPDTIFIQAKLNWRWDYTQQFYSDSSYRELIIHPDRTKCSNYKIDKLPFIQAANIIKNKK